MPLGKKTKDKTFAPRRRGDTEKNNKDRWVRAGPPAFRSIQDQGFDISTSPLHQKIEYTELRLTHGVAAFPWPRFSYTRMQNRTPNRAPTRSRDPGIFQGQLPGVPACHAVS